MIYINTFIENYYIIKYLVVNANILYNLPVEKEEKEKMKWTKKMKGAGKKAAVTVTALGMVLTAFPPIPAKAAEEFAGQLTSVESVEKGSKDNIVVVKFNGGVTAQLTFLEDGIFRYNVDPSGEFSKYATPKSQAHVGRIQQYSDDSSNYSHPKADISG